MNEPVPRPPGWKLIANHVGSQGWHLVGRTNPERSVVTACGITGRVITENNRQIVCCQACAEAPQR